MKRKFGLLISLLMLFILPPLANPTQAQDTVRISVAVPDNVAEVLQNGILAQFEAANPGVSVYVNETGGGRFGGGGGALSDVASYLDAELEDVTENDVMLVNANDITVESTRAGYYLDMTPLVSVDAAFNSADYYPTVWNSYQWDGGVWALPVAADAVVMLYDAAAFDAAGLPYPTENWTLFDLDNAARSLATVAADGSVETAGLGDLGGYMPMIVLNMIGGSVYDDSGLQTAPSFSNPAIAQQLDLWSALAAEGYMTSGFQGGFNAPMTLAPSVLANNRRFVGEREMVTLPGGRAGLDVSAFAISSGTQYREQAYALAAFLTQQPDVVNAVTGVVPARQSLASLDGTNADGGAGFAAANPQRTAELQPLIANALSVADVRFGNRLTETVTLMNTNNLDAATALLEVEAAALTDLQIAADRAATTTVFVTPPPTEVVLGAGEVGLTFGVQGQFGRGNNNAAQEARWDSVASTFVANDPQVGNVEIEFEGGGTDVTEMATAYDCFYLSSNAVQGADLSLLLPLDPLLNSDPTFNPADLVGDTLAQVQSNGQTYAMPLMIQPEALLYNADLFNQNGVLLPSMGWTVSDFENALRSLRLFPDDPEPFIPQQNSNTYMLLLVAAYGGVPVDYSTNPPTLNFSDPNAVAAAQQVLDLAKEGYIAYDGLGGAFGARGAGFGAGSDEDIALYNQLLNSFVIDTVAEDVSYGLTTYPDGAQLNAVAYDTGTAYISANTQNPEACYRFISALAQQPELFDGMPARASQLNSPQLVAAQGQAAVDFYNSVNAALNNPNTLVFPTAFSGGTTAVGESLALDWLYRAYDSYVLEDADLAAEVADAQIKADTYLQCYGGLPPFDASTQERGEYFAQISACAAQADPEPSGLFNN